MSGNNDKQTAVKDYLGNTLYVGSLVTLQLNFPIVGKVVEIQEGGIQTTRGMMPTQLRVICDWTIQSAPGQRVPCLARVVDPNSEAIVQKLIELPPGTTPQ